MPRGIYTFQVFTYDVYGAMLGGSTIRPWGLADIHHADLHDPSYTEQWVTGVSARCHAWHVL